MDFKITAIINAWADTLELLPFCISNIASMVDDVVVIWSKKSNRGNESDDMLEFILAYNPGFQLRNRVFFRQLEPIKASPNVNEIRKRNYGLKCAYEIGATHFIMMDADEFYRRDEFLLEWRKFITNKDLNGVVCKLKVFIGKPTLWCDDHTLVPAIHKLRRNTEVGPFRRYPFAVDKGGTAHIDPTRRVNETNGVIMGQMTMYHMSYVRKNMKMKIDNSSANLSKSQDMIMTEIGEAHAGYKSKMYNQILQECPNYFNISF